jgi:hypothetical protein
VESERTQSDIGLFLFHFAGSELGVMGGRAREFPDVAVCKQGTSVTHGMVTVLTQKPPERDCTSQSPLGKLFVTRAELVGHLDA